MTPETSTQKVSPVCPSQQQLNNNQMHVIFWEKKKSKGTFLLYLHCIHVWHKPSEKSTQFVLNTYCSHIGEKDHTKANPKYIQQRSQLRASPHSRNQCSCNFYSLKRSCHLHATYRSLWLISNSNKRDFGSHFKVLSKPVSRLADSLLVFVNPDSCRHEIFKVMVSYLKLTR